MLKLYKENRLLFNATFSVGQIVFVGLTYFIIYTLLLHKLGPEKLGVWSLILSTTSVASIATTGLTLSLVKYIAAQNQEIDYIKINNYIKTGLFIISTLTIAIVFIVFILASFFLPLVIPNNHLEEAFLLLPFSLMSLFLNSIGGVFLSTLEGLHNSILKSIATIISTIFFTVIAYLLIDKYGLLGIAIAQIVQAVIILVMGILFLKAVFKKLSLFPIFFDKKTFREIFAYSVSFQFISVSTILIEPTVKFMISRFGGLSFVGYYEMGSRLVTQIRGLIISANQIMVPHIAKKTALNIDKIDSTYPVLFKLVFYVSMYLMILLIMLAPVISELWIGNFNYMFVISLIILSIATVINLFSTPAYFSSMGVGKLKGILASHFAFLILNAIFGFILGQYYGGIGVVVAYSFSLIISSFITIIYYHKIYNFNIISLLNQNREFFGLCFNSFFYIIWAILLIYFAKTLTTFLYISLCFSSSFLFLYMVYLRDQSIKLLVARIQKTNY